MFSIFEDEKNIVSPIFLLYQDLIARHAFVINFVDKNFNERCTFIEMIIFKLMEKTFTSRPEEKLIDKITELDIYTPKEPFISPSAGVNSITIPLYFFIDYNIKNLPSSLTELQTFLNKATRNMNYEFNYQLTQRDWFKFSKICHFLQYPKDKILQSLKSILLHELGHLYYHHPVPLKNSDFFIYKILNLINENIANKAFDKYSDLYILYLKYFPVFLYSNYQEEKLADEFIARFKDPSLINGIDAYLESGLTTTESYYDKFLTGAYRLGSIFTHGNHETRKNRIKEAHKFYGISCQEKKSSGHSYIARMSKDFL